jgi:hypothetical protein
MTSFEFECSELRSQYLLCYYFLYPCRVLWLIADCCSVTCISLGGDQVQSAFAQEVVRWVEGKVAKHKWLRGGVAVIDVIPKRCVGL